MKVAQGIYLHPLSAYVSRFLPEKGIQELSQAKQSLHALFSHSLPSGFFAQHVTRFYQEQASIILGVQLEEPSMTVIASARNRTAKVTEGLSHVGLAGPKVERLFAEVMHAILGQSVANRYAGKWEAPSHIPSQLQDWIENQFARFIVEVLSRIQDKDGDGGKSSTTISYADTQKWQQMGIRRLGELRVSELFNIIADWNQGSQGAIEDLKHYVRDSRWRHHLAAEFCEVLSRRLLHPGASTTEILQIYISIIRAFTALDPKGVLLDRVARPIRRYLKERDDTVNIVVGGLLANLEDDPPDPNVLYELAEELDTTGGLPADEKANDVGDLDFDDMSWEPDPVDAPPGRLSGRPSCILDSRVAEYKRSKHNDVIGALISLFDTKEAFVKEFQKILGDRLLRKEHDFEKEVYKLSQPIHQLLTPKLDQSFRTSQDSLWRSEPSSMRSYASGYHGLATNRRVCAQETKPYTDSKATLQDPFPPLLASFTY